MPCTQRPTGAIDVRIALVGLGLMGSAMAQRWIDAGFEVAGFDLDERRRAEHTARGGSLGNSPAEVASTSQVVVLSLPNSDIVREVCLGNDGLVALGRTGLLIIDTTTARPEDTEEIGALVAKTGSVFMDATLSGNAAQASAGDIVAMVGCDPRDFARARSVLDVITRSVHHVGPLGSGARTKLIVNLIVGVHRTALAEALVVGEKAGLALEPLLGVLKDGAAYSRAMDIWGDRMVQGDHFPPASRMRQNHKDFKLILDLGQTVGAPTFLASTVRQMLAIAEATGLADADNSGIAEIMRRAAGVGRLPY